MTDAQIFRQAAQRVRQGWCQHLFEDDAGRVCARGAIQMALWGVTAVRDPMVQNAEMPLSLRAVSILGLVPGSCGLICAAWALAIWNNEPNRTAEEVALALEWCALVIEQEETQAAERSDAHESAAVVA